jgi:hypothetical protein
VKANQLEDQKGQREMQKEEEEDSVEEEEEEEIKDLKKKNRLH